MAMERCSGSAEWWAGRRKRRRMASEREAWPRAKRPERRRQGKSAVVLELSIWAQRCDGRWKVPWRRWRETSNKDERQREECKRDAGRAAHRGAQRWRRDGRRARERGRITETGVETEAIWESSWRTMWSNRWKGDCERGMVSAQGAGFEGEAGGRMHMHMCERRTRRALALRKTGARRRASGRWGEDRGRNVFASRTNARERRKTREGRNGRIDDAEMGGGRQDEVVAG